MSATPELSTPAETTAETDFDFDRDSSPEIRSHTEALAWAMFVAGYNARIEDSTRETEFRDRDAFDTHLYEQFRAVYTDS